MKNFIEKLEELNLFLVEKNGDLILKGRKGVLSKDEIEMIKKNNFIIDFIKENKPSLIDYLRNNSTKRPIYKLSALQEGMLFHGLYDKRSKAYSKQLTVDFPKGLDVDIFKKTWDWILKHHSILRSCFIYDSVSIPLQSVFEKVNLPVKVLDYSAYSASEQQEAFSQLLKDDIEKGFDFSEPPLIRATLVKTNAVAYSMILTHHHILWDGWSTAILMREFQEVYSAYLHGKEPPRRAEDNFEDYIQYIKEKDESEAQLFWKNYLDGLNKASLLPFINNAEERNKGGGNSRKVSLRFDPDATNNIKNFAQSNRITVSTIMQGVWSFLLSKYTNSSNVCFGVTVSGRPSDLEDAEQRVGLFINTLPLYTSVNGNQNLLEWLTTLQEDQLASREYQYCSLNTIQNWIGLVGDFFDSILVYENFPEQKFSENGASLVVDNVKGHQYELTNYPLTIVIVLEESLSIHFNYNDKQISQTYIDGIAGHFETLIHQIVNHGKISLDELDMLSEKEKHHLIHEYNNLTVAFPKEKTIVDLFEEQVQRSPDHIAVVYREKKLTYKELNEKANQIGHYLKKLGVQPGSLVAIGNKDPLDFFVSIWGVMKSGAAYVPIDVDLPGERIQFLLKDTQAAFILTSETSPSLLKSHDKAILLDRDRSIIQKESVSNVTNDLKPDSLIYVIYTSGSTGKPKGVMLTHQNLTDYLFGLFAQVDMQANRSFGLLSTMSADLGNTILFSAMTIGGELHLFDKDSLSDGWALQNYFKTNPVDCIKIVPSHWKALEVEGQLLLPNRLIIFGGEELPVELIDKIKRKDSELEIINHYGPTEATIGKLLHAVDLNKEYSSIPIGQPFSNSTIYIVDENLSLCPEGVAGELLIGGMGVSKGYLNRAELNKAKFITDPFNKETKGKLYRTGDWVRMLPNGDIEFKGRIDDQIKVRGYRIELGEVQSVLQKSNLVDQCLVLGDTDSNGDKRLVGYFVPAENNNKTNIQEYLKDQLPAYMVPLLVQLEQFPLTSNGKIDRKALPKPDVNDLAEQEFVAPSSSTEIRIAEIWKKKLKLDKIGVNDDFFELGGHSLLATRVVAAIRKQLKVKLAIKDIFTNRTIAELARKVERNVEKEQTTIKKQLRPEKIPLSYTQERLWFIHQLEGSVHYHMPFVLRAEGQLDVAALEYAFKTIVDRHEILRTTYQSEAGRPFQHILQPGGWKLTVIDSYPSIKDQDLQDLIAEEVHSPFDLSKDHMIKATLIKLSEHEHVLVIVVHHIASDGWSMPILMGELEKLYQTKVTGVAVDLAPLPIQYADYAIWEKTNLDEKALEKQLAYWNKKLKGTEVLNLPLDFPRSLKQQVGGDRLFFNIDEELTGQLKERSKEFGATLFMFLLSAFKVMLSKYSGQTDICVGAPIANRTQEELENLIGFFINTLALRSDLSGNPSFVKFLEQVKQTSLDAYSHQSVPFAKVVDSLELSRDMNISPLFQVMFIMRNNKKIMDEIKENTILRSDEVEFTMDASNYVFSKFDLTLIATETEDRLSFIIEYRNDLFSAETIHRMKDHYQLLLRSIVAKPDENISNLSMLSPSEKKQLLEEFNDTAIDYPLEKTVVDLFEEQVKKRPDGIAIHFGGQTLTYRDLDERANQLANFLIAKGVSATSQVVVCLDRSIAMVVALLAVLKSGKAYIPVDPEYPVSRIKYIVENSKADYIVSEKSHRHLFGSPPGAEVILLDQDDIKIARESTHKPDIQLSSDQLAYIIYTSGSTGNPKGVMVEHESLTNFLLSMQENISFDSSSSMLAVTTYSFDIAYLEIYLPLLSGGRLYLASKQETDDPYSLKEMIQGLRPSHMQATPATWQQLVDSGWTNEEALIILCGGEAIKESLKNSLTNLSDQHVWNMYGPTETTIWSTMKKLSSTDKVTIGQPIANTQVYVLNANEENTSPELLPMGVVGELCIAGKGLARGYWEQPDMTAKKFIKDTITHKKGSRIYRTGDLARWLNNGELECLGRIDHQIKIRGFRVELGEVEAVLQKSPLVKDAVVAVREDSMGHNQLVGYIVTQGAFRKEEILAFLKSMLPAYMIPYLLMEITSIPLTPNGKVDKKALPDPDVAASMSSEYQAPTSPTEKALSTIWSELLEVEQVGGYDNFFELGGHSLLIVRIVSAIRSDLQVEVSIKDLFDHSTVAGLAKYIDDKAPQFSLPKLIRRERPKRVPLSFAQERLWFIDQLEGSVHYHLSTILHIEGELDVVTLRDVFREIVHRHEILRTVYYEYGGEGFQEVLSAEQWDLEEIKCTHQQQGEMARSVIHEPFDLTKDYMFRATLLHHAAQDYSLVLVMHHIASDAWSAAVFIRELMEGYQAKVDNRKAELPELPVQYADYALWQKNLANEGLMDPEFDYWINKLKGVEPIDLPTDFVRPNIQSTKGKVVRTVIDSEQYARLKLLARQEEVTMFMMMLSIFKVLLSQYSGQKDFCVGSPISNRNTKELEPLIGFFLNTVALRTSLEDNMTFRSFLKKVKETTIEAYTYQNAPFEKVIDLLDLERDLSRTPLFQTLFVLQQASEKPRLELHNVTFSVDPHEKNSSKFDLTFSISESDEGVFISAEYCSDLFLPQTIERMLEHYKMLISAVVIRPDEQIHSLSMLSVEEEKQVLVDFNGTERVYPAHKTIIDLVEAQVKKTPNKVALVFADKTFTYKELNDRSNQLARYIQTHARVEKGACIAVCMQRSEWSAITMLAIAKLGCVYVPLDLNLPESRLAFLAEDSTAKAIIVNGDMEFPKTTRENTYIFLDIENGQPLAGYSSSNLSISIDPLAVSYVIYTSGSTGLPKGVEQTHAMLYNLLRWDMEESGMLWGQKHLQFSSFSFDSSLHDIYYALSTGGEVHILPEEIRRDLIAIKDYVIDQQISTLSMPYSAIKPFFGEMEIEDFKGHQIREIISTGEQLYINGGLRSFLKAYPEVNIFNLYGPSETHVVTGISYSFNDSDTPPVKALIGKPVFNTSILVLNDQLQAVPIGVKGEIYVGGLSLAKGYKGNEELTKERFIRHPVYSDSILYKTGDLGRWLPDGNLEYLGRKDDQVKIRGYRIELGEIEAVLQRISSVNQAVVLARKDTNDNDYLVAFIEVKPLEKKVDIQAHLRSSLPEYMIPPFIIELSEFPLTTNGKVDKKALPAPDRSTIASNEYVSARDETEEQLVKVWEALLSIDGIGVHDDFFELGGHSLLAIKLTNAIRMQFSVQIPLKVLFQLPTIGDLAKYIRLAKSETEEEFEMDVYDF